MTQGTQSNGEKHPLAEFVPQFARRILHMGCGRGHLARTLKTERGCEVYGQEKNAEAACFARQYLTELIESDPAHEPLPFPEGFFDCILAERPDGNTERLGAVLTNLASLLAPHGLLLLIVQNPGFWKCRVGLAAPPPVTMDEARQSLGQSGLGLYGTRTIVDAEVAAMPVSEDGGVVIDGHRVEAGSREELAVLATFGEILIGVTSAYNPLAHARELFDQKHPDWSYEILSLIPKLYLKDDEISALVAAEMQFCLLALDYKDSVDREVARRRLARFWEAQTLFYRAVAYMPNEPGPYQCQAEFWHRLGNDDMARKYWHSIMMRKK